MNATLDNLHIKIFADGADKSRISQLGREPLIRGFTTNPTLMRQAGVADYEAFASEVLPCIGGRPISFEVFSDDFDEMYRQALHIAGWGENVFVKIPITNTRGESARNLVRRLAEQHVKVNVTAVMTCDQVQTAAECLAGGPHSYISVFAGRIADTGRDPLQVIEAALKIVGHNPEIELIWASPRELLNIFQADAVGCHIITVTPDILKKLSMIGRDLHEFSLDTVKMFHSDALSAGYAL